MGYGCNMSNVFVVDIWSESIERGTYQFVLSKLSKDVIMKMIATWDIFKNVGLRYVQEHDDLSYDYYDYTDTFLQERYAEMICQSVVSHTINNSGPYDVDNAFDFTDTDFVTYYVGIKECQLIE